MGKLYHYMSCYTNLGQYWIKCFCVHSSSIIHVFDHKKKLALSISVGFHKNSLIVAYCTFARFKFRTLTSSRFKNQTNDIFKILSHNCIHQQGFLKQKIVTLHHCRFNLKFPKHCYSDSYFDKHYWWNNSDYKLEQ